MLVGKSVAQVIESFAASADANNAGSSRHRCAAANRKSTNAALCLQFESICFNEMGLTSGSLAAS